jgi:hypothetical protein
MRDDIVLNKVAYLELRPSRSYLKIYPPAD